MRDRDRSPNRTENARAFVQSPQMLVKSVVGARSSPLAFQDALKIAGMTRGLAEADSRTQAVITFWIQAFLIR
jgi:hypothetical protein